MVIGRCFFMGQDKHNLCHLLTRRMTIISWWYSNNGYRVFPKSVKVLFAGIFVADVLVRPSIPPLLLEKHGLTGLKWRLLKAFKTVQMTPKRYINTSCWAGIFKRSFWLGVDTGTPFSCSNRFWWRNAHSCAGCQLSESNPDLRGCWPLG